jgi:hypothetical protein
MKRAFRHPAIIALVILLGVVIGCKTTTTSNSGSNSNDNSGSTKNTNSNTNSSPPSNAPAPDIAGKYNITGDNPNGTNYKGTLEVIKRGDVYQFKWNAGSEYDGVGVQNGKIIAVAYTTGTDGKGCGVIDYDIRSDGTLAGKWGYWGINEAGTETATRTSGSDLVGAYKAKGKNPNGKEYEAGLTVEPAAGNLYRFVWSNDTDGLGIKRGDNVAVGIGGGRCGFVMYQVQSDGSLDGIWGGVGSEKTGTEKATKQ